MRRTSLTILLASLLAFFSTPPAAAGEGNFEIAAGAYVAGSGFVGDEAAYGLRGGYRFTERWGLQGSLSRVELFDLYGPYAGVEGDATFFDVSGQFFFTPGRRAELYLYGGIGMARFDIDVGRIRVDLPYAGRVETRGFSATFDDDFTTHIGLGVNIRLNEKMYLRPDIRHRWLGSAGGGTLDVEPSIALGWRF